MSDSILLRKGISVARNENGNVELSQGDGVQAQRSVISIDVADLDTVYHFINSCLMENQRETQKIQDDTKSGGTDEEIRDNA